MPRKWQDLIADMQAATARKEDPAGPVAQALAKRYRDLIEAFTMGDSGIERGLAKSYQAGTFPSPYGKDVQQFIDQAVQAAKK